jgi:hypothetical protein
MEDLCKLINNIRRRVDGQSIPNSGEIQSNEMESSSNNANGEDDIVQFERFLLPPEHSTQGNGKASLLDKYADSEEQLTCLLNETRDVLERYFN